VTSRRKTNEIALGRSRSGTIIAMALAACGVNTAANAISTSRIGKQYRKGGGQCRCDMADRQRRHGCGQQHCACRRSTRPKQPGGSRCTSTIAPKVINTAALATEIPKSARQRVDHAGRADD
jgi:hypothetical protein